MKNLKIAKIQQKLKDKKIDSLIINRTDEFLNEYIPPDAERLYWATNFSGSAGRAIICQNTSNLFVDGRYTFQAKEQIDENAISLLHWNDFSTELSKHFDENKCVALDPMLHSIEEVNKIVELAKEKKTKLGTSKGQVKLTVSRALSDEIETRERSLASVKRARQTELKNSNKDENKENLKPIKREIKIPEAITVRELANRMEEQSSNVNRFLY